MSVSHPLPPVSSFKGVVYFSASSHAVRLHDATGREVLIQAEPLPRELRKIFYYKETPLQRDAPLIPGVLSLERVAYEWEPPSKELAAEFWRYVLEGDFPEDVLVRVFVSPLTAQAAPGARIPEALGDNNNLDVLLPYTGRQKGLVRYGLRGEVYSSGAVSFVSPVRPL